VRESVGDVNRVDGPWDVEDEDLEVFAVNLHWCELLPLVPTSRPLRHLGDCHVQHLGGKAQVRCIQVGEVREMTDEKCVCLRRRERMQGKWVM
jgi:hypothetical protein